MLAPELCHLCPPCSAVSYTPLTSHLPISLSLSRFLPLFLSHTLTLASSLSLSSPPLTSYPPPLPSPTAKACQAEFERNEKGVSKLRAELAAIQTELSDLNFSPEDEPRLQAEHAAADSRRAQLRDTVDELSARLASVNFTYSDPSKGFDRSKVNGLVAELVTVADESHSAALEVTAGGRLYNVVVADEVTGKQLLANGKLRRRVTIIPLNKVNSRTVAPAVVAEAKRQVGADNVDLALSLVGYPEEVAAAMEYVFGSTLICKTMDMARKVSISGNEEGRVRRSLPLGSLGCGKEKGTSKGSLWEVVAALKMER